MNTVFLLLGSNLADRMLMLSQAMEQIQIRIGLVKEKSGIYQSAPWGFEASTSFLNQVIIIESVLEPLEMLEQIKQIEKEMGRVKTSDGYESRIIDIDILFFNDEVIELPNLIIPHPQLHKRKFTLVPLAEIAGLFIHPQNKKTMQQLLDDCNDFSEVSIFL